jgi:3-(3-hydroxy-phenyl)propionate hydroxylase
MPPFAGQGLCSGLRDAANLAWKFAAIKRGASERLLDSYQLEREPHVRAIIAMAMMMGHTVCITDPEAARARDAHMLAARAAGASPDGTVSYPPLERGCVLDGAPGAGAYFPQPIAADGSMLDNVLGAGAWLICRGPSQASSAASGLCWVSLGDPVLAPFRSRLDAWLAEHKAEAVLVRPDRYVFGAGDAEALQRAWTGWST